MTDDSNNARKDIDLLELTAHIVSAYVEKNRLPVSGLGDLIASVSASISGLGQPVVPVAAPLVPAVNPKKSVTPDFIICLEDGKKFKSLKRHLGVHFGLTPDAYRAKWGLPADYPMVAPNYAASRSHWRSRSASAARPPRCRRQAKAKGQEGQGSGLSSNSALSQQLGRLEQKPAGESALAGFMLLWLGWNRRVFGGKP